MGPPLSRPVQVAYAVTGVADAAARFAATTGAGPFFVIQHIQLSWSRIEGREARFDHSSAYGQWGDLMVELVEEHSPPIVAPAGAVHHVAFTVPDLDDAIGWCAGRDWPEVLRAETVGGQEFAYCDARSDLGHLIELYEAAEALVRFYRMVADASVGWDGVDPVRRLGGSPATER